MKNLLTTLLACLLLLPALSFGQSNGCSGRLDLIYPTGNTVARVTLNNGDNGPSATYCPSSSSAQQVVIEPVNAGNGANAQGTLTLSYTLNGVPVTQTKTTTNGGGDVAGTGRYAFTLPTATELVVYTITSLIDCRNEKPITFTLSLAPTLTLSTTAFSVCEGSSVTLTSTGSGNGQYTWSAPGLTTVTNGGTLTVSPTQTTTYTVTAPTSCGTQTQQQITISVPTLTATNSFTTCSPAGTPFRLTAASNVAGATFRWTTGGTLISENAFLDVQPGTTTTYRVTSSATDGCPTATFRDVTVTVGGQQAVAVSPASPTIFRSTSTTLRATSNAFNPTFTWRTGGATGPVVFTGPNFTTAPTTTTTYTVTSTGTGAGANCGPASQDVTVTVSDTPLPVELTAFEVRTAGAAALLTWTTSQELNNEFFAVERSLDGRRFAAVGRVTGAGTTRARTEYRFTDALAEVRAGTTLYYRLRQVDYSGSVQYSPVRTLQVGARATALLASVQPNPLDATSSLRVVTPQAGPLSYTIHDAAGRQLAAESVMAAEGAQTLPLPALAAARAGLYFLVVRQGSQRQVLRLSHR